MKASMMDTSFFHAYDIRGLIDSELNDQAAERIGRAFGTIIKGKPVVVGRDIRYSSTKIAPAFIRGLVSTGCSVTDIGECPSPMLMFNAFNLKQFGAIMAVLEAHQRLENRLHGQEFVGVERHRRVPASDGRGNGDRHGPA